MRLVGLNFTKISASREKAELKEIKIDANMDIKDISEIKSNLIKSKEDILKVSFFYSLNYSPGIAKLEFEGDLILSLDPKETKDILKEWKDKKMSNKFRLSVFNIILKKCTIKALQLEEELNIPPHFNLPSLKLDKKE